MRWQALPLLLALPFLVAPSQTQDDKVWLEVEAKTLQAAIAAGDLAAGGDVYVGVTGGDAAETTLTLNNYDPLVLSLAESFDTGSTFTTSANEVCYTGTPTVNFHISFAFSVARTTGTGTDVVTIAFGQDTTGAIDDGDEFGEEYPRSFAGADTGMGIVETSAAFATNDCLSVLAKTNDTSGGSGFTVSAGNLRLTEF